jgi:dihydrofolate synthase/folylpolyglutamate synthase
LQVAGTNGKGSTSAYLAAGLRSAGMSVGLFTSPHLVDFRERVRVNGEPIGEAEVVRAWGEIRSEVERRSMTFFEANTAIALTHFAARACDVAVLETGMGGRLDSTTAARASVCVLTRIAFDHREYLGKTLEAIAAEKAAILWEGARGFSAPQAPEAERAIRESAGRVGSELTFVGYPEDVRVDADGTAFRWRDEPVRLRMVGRHQAQNALLALEALAEVLPGAPTRALADSLQPVELPGRFQRLELPPGTLLLDVAHNPDALACFARALEDAYPGRAKRVFVAMLRDKDLGSSLEALAGCEGLRRPLLVGSAESAPESRRLRREDWLRLPEPLRERCTWIGGVLEGLAALEAWQSERPAGVAALVGSFTSVGEAMQRLGVDPLRG